MNRHPGNTVWSFPVQTRARNFTKIPAQHCKAALLGQVNTSPLGATGQKFGTFVSPSSLLPSLNKVFKKKVDFMLILSWPKMDLSDISFQKSLKLK